MLKSFIAEWEITSSLFEFFIKDFCKLLWCVANIAASAGAAFPSAIFGSEFSEKLIEFSTDDFKSEVVESNTPVLVDFWAEWCGPCRVIAPVVEELANDYEGKVKFGKVNVDDHNQVASEYGVRSIPTLLIFKDGAVVNQIVGSVPKEKITDILDTVV